MTESFRKNMELTLTIDDLTNEGMGVGKYDGYTIFVKDALIGDTVRVSLTKVKKKYAYARLVQIVEASPDRVTPLCPVAGPCGGCQLQALSYRKQLEFKEKKVLNNLLHIGNIPQEILQKAAEPIIGMDDPWHYRNKTQFPVQKGKDGKPVAGFYAGRTHSVIKSDDCALGISENKTILNILLDHMQKYQIAPYDETTGAGLVRHILIRKGFATGEILVCAVINGRSMPQEDILARKLAEVPGMKSISLNVNMDNTNVILGNEVRLLWGEDYITDRIGDLSYRISPLSFFQVNPVQTEKLYMKALEYAGLQGNENVWDLYCGAGTISLFLARNAASVSGVEIVPAAIRDARANAAINGIENVRFYTGRAEEIFPAESVRKGILPDVVVLDPPRKGCEESLLESILQCNPDRIVYVSCDSATLARDIRILREGGYEVERLCPVDMFPMTVHVETACLLIHS